MKYWIITTEYPPFFGGGISTYCKYTAEMLQRKGHEVSVFIPDYKVDEIVEEILVGVRVIRFLPRQTNVNSFLGSNASLSYEFAEVIKRFILKEGAPEILESQEYSGIAFYIQQFKLLGYPLFKHMDILITCHAPSFLCLEYNQVPIYQFPEYWTGQMEKATIKSADLLITPSKFFVSEAKTRMDWSNIHEVHVFNPMVISGGHSDAKIKAFPKRIVSFGKLAPLKGTFELLSYFEALWLEGHELQLDLVGGTQQIFHPESRTMGDVVKSKYKPYLDRGLLRLHNEMAPDAAKEFVLSAQIVIVPSLFDNLPYTVLESMSWGKVVLASRQGGQSEIIDDEINGFLFDHKVPGEFQEKLLHILSLPSDVVHQIGENARNSITKRFHPDVIYLQKMEAIQRYLSGKSKRQYFPFIERPLSQLPMVSSSGLSNDMLSIVIPYYNMGAYIEACVQSVLNSEYDNKEVIIIDDGSNDPDSIEQLNLLQEKYPVNVYSKKNEGLSVTRNFGASKAKGEFLAFLDADDIVEKTYYSKAIRVLQTYQNVHFIGCWVKYFEESTGFWPTFNPEPPYLLLHNMVNSSALVYKKHAFMQAGQNDKDLIYGMEDWESVISLVTKGFGGVVLPELLFNYRVRKGSMARSFTRVKRLFLYKHIMNKHATAYKEYGVEIAHLSINNGSGLVFDNPTLAVATGRFSSLKGKIREMAKHNTTLRKVAYFIYQKVK